MLFYFCLLAVQKEQSQFHTDLICKLKLGSLFKWHFIKEKNKTVSDPFRVNEKRLNCFSDLRIIES